MHDGIPYDPIPGQGQGHGASEVPKIALFKVYLHRHLQWELANGQRCLNYRTISKFSWAAFLWPPCIAGCGHIYFRPVSLFFLFLA